MSLADHIRKVEPYVAGEQPKDKTIIKLNTNECPYPPSPKVAEAARDIADHYEDLRLYPDMDVTLLRDSLAEYYGLKPSEVFVGVGSDDVLSMCFMTFFNGDQPVLFPDITYSFYDVWASLHKVPYQTIPLNEELLINPEDYMPEKTGVENGGVIFPNPNAPTGAYLPLSEIRSIIAANPEVVVIVDEAYIDFGGTSALSLLKEFDNLVVVQTFSKSRAMAGMRIGYAMGNETLIRYLNDVKFSFNSYTMNPTAILLGTAAVKDDVYFKDITSKIIETREWFSKEMKAMGFVFAESKANFIFAKHPEISGDELFAKLREHKICVRHFAKPRIEEYLRITIGTKEQMEAVVNALHEILK